jgi:hypothetical protein
MNTVERTEQAVRLAERWGYRIRRQSLGGVSSGACEFGGCRWIFLDVAQSAQEQLEVLIDVLRNDPRASGDGNHKAA